MKSHNYSRSIRTRTVCVANATKYKALPSDWKTKAHYYFYGWAVTNEVLQRYLSTINKAHVSCEDEIGTASSAIFYMQRDVGFHHINYVGGKVDDEAAANCRVEQTEEGPMLNLMSIGCTRSKRLFWRRPTPKQLERLIEIFGEKPRWFEDFYTKEEFDHELMH
ncbi:hypothetical protein BYT27DRAFT_7149144 [Phlegmacium glaucopus]|nr:hypothetical protein BYT27DRAFT_7149144 [Phlegmacium glaucopus]